MLNGLKERMRKGINVRIYPDSWLDTVNNWIQTKSGLSAFVLSLCLGLVFITIQLLIVQMKSTEHLSGAWAIPSACGIAVFLELFSYVCAIRGLVIGSGVGVFVSVLVLRGTFGSQYFDSNISFFMPFTWDYPYFLSWVLSAIFPFIVGYLSHQIKTQMEYEEIAKEKLKESDPQAYRELYGNF